MPASQAAPTPGQSAAPVPTPIPVPEIVTQAEAAAAKLQELQTDLADGQTAATIDEQLPALTREVDARLADTSKILEARPSLETLRNLEMDWRALNENLPVWRRELTTRATQLEQEIAQIATLASTWEQTLELARSSNAPPELTARAETIIAAIRQTRVQLDNARARILTLQSRVSEQEARTSAALVSVKQAREAMVGRLLVKDSPPIWGASIRQRTGGDLWREARQSVVTQFAALREYASRSSDRLALHAALFLLFIGALYWARRRVHPWVKEGVAKEPDLASATMIFELPIGTALLLTILISGWIYPQAPRLLTALLGAAALAPAIIIMRRLVARSMYSILNALVIFYLIDRLRDVAQALPLLSRLLFLAEMLSGIIFLAWLLASARLANVPETERNGLWRTIRLIARAALPVFIAAFAANAFGYIGLARLIGNAALGSAYVAVIFYVAVRILDGLVIFGLRVRPLALLGSVRNHRALLWRRIIKILRWITGLAWILVVLELLSLREPILTAIINALTAELAVGALRLSVGNIVAFCLTVWLAFLLSRFIRFLLEEDVYPRLALARGVPYAASTMLHYAVLLGGFLLALGAFGFDLNKFTILAGAFGVGIGFGLQNIVNNFVSGLILLFERPVNVGDAVELDGEAGELKRIGLRASVIRTLEGSEVIVPNGSLISGKVINWTLSDQQRRIEIGVGVAYGTDPERVIELLTRVAAEHPDVMQAPAPQTLFVGFGDSALDFQLRAWTSHFERWQVIKSELAIAMNKALQQENISIPFPQRDLHLVSLAPEIRKSLAENNVTPVSDKNAEQAAPPRQAAAKDQNKYDEN